VSELVLGIDVGGSSVKTWTAGPRGCAELSAPLPVIRAAPGRAEFDPDAWWQIIARQVRAAAGQAGGRIAGLVVSSMRQAFVLIGGAHELGRGVLNSDRRGAPYLPRLRRIGGLYETTGHWPAPELTLGKLVAIADREPGRWAAAQRLLFVHDWLIWRLTGEQVTEVSYACAGQLADVRGRRWADGILAQAGLGTSRLAPLAEPGTLAGKLTDGSLGLPAGLPVQAGCGDTQLAAMGAGGLAADAITVVAGSSTPVQAATTRPAADPQRRAWVSTHARPGIWAAETNAGYPGTMSSWLRGLIGTARRHGRPGASGVTATVATPEWSEHAWAVKAPMSLTGLSPATTAADLAQALDEAHAFAVRANIADLETATGRAAAQVIVTGGGAGHLAPLLADVLGRPVQVCQGSAGAMRAGWELVTGTALPAPPGQTASPQADPAAYEAAYRRYLRTHAALRAHLPEEDS
jgi:sugar (pentulose or hexulose) kinase